MDVPSDHLLRTLAAVGPGCRILDAGCGSGAHTEVLHRLGFEVWACDADPAQVTATRERMRGVDEDFDAEARVTVGHPGAMGYPDDYFDWVVAFGTLDALAPDERLSALDEVRRVLAPGAWVFVGAEELDAYALLALTEAAGLALAERPAAEPGGGIRGIFRKVEAGTAA